MQLQIGRYIALLEAVVHQAERDLTNINRKGKEHKFWGEDAKVFFNSEYYANIEEILYTWYHRRNSVPHISYVIDNA